MAALAKSLGAAIRTAGQAIDSMGAAMQGRYAYRETCKALSDNFFLSMQSLTPTLIKASRHETLPTVGLAVSKHQTLQAFNSKKPQLAEDIFVAPNSSMIGDVSLGKSSSVWYGAVLRGRHKAPELSAQVLLDQPVLLWQYATLILCQMRSRIADLNCLAGDVNSIKVGENSNIQDNCIVHVAKHNAQDRALPTIIGNNVTIGRYIWLLAAVRL